MRDCLIVGAGAAGLACARDLSRAGCDVVVLEARDRIGGRIHTVHDPGCPVPIELGAEFIHGEATETLDITDEAGLVVNYLPDSHLWSRNGKFEAVPDFWEKVLQAAASIARRAKRSGDKGSFLDHLERSRLPSRIRALLLQYVEGYHAPDPAKMSAIFPGGDGEDIGDPASARQFRIASGYDTVMNWLRWGCDNRRVEVRLDTEVIAIRWRSGEVSVESRHPLLSGPETEWQARTAVITVPPAFLGAWISFDPDIPEKRTAARRLHSGQVVKSSSSFGRLSGRNTRSWRAGSVARRATPRPSISSTTALPRWVPGGPPCRPGVGFSRPGAVVPRPIGCSTCRWEIESKRRSGPSRVPRE